jgi:flagellar biosynthesis protein FlhG
MFSSVSKGLLKRPIPEDTIHKPWSSQAPRQEKSQSNSAPPRTSTLSRRPEEARMESRQAGQTKEGNPMSNNNGPRIISVGGGKGGIGKSFFSANMAVSLTRLGYKVSLVDLDLGSANLHTCLGVPSPKVGLFDFVNGQVDSLEEVAVSGGVPGLTLYGGGQEFWQQIRPHSVQKIKLISKLQRLDADYVILDLGAGTHVNTLDFFIFSHAGIVVVVPEPTSIENAYVFLKSVLFRKLQSVVKAIRQEEATQSLMNSLSDPKIPVPPLTQLQKFATEYPEVGQKILQLIQMTQLGVVMNQVRTKSDADIGTSITQICKRYFGFQAEFIGSTAYDDNVWKSVRSRRPVCVDFPDSPVTLSLAEIADCISHAFLPPASAQVHGIAK